MQFRLKGDKIHFPKKSGLAPLRTRQTCIQQVRLVPKSSCYVIEVVYNIHEQESIINDHKAALDPGLNNLATLTFSHMEKSYVVGGRGLKSINQNYNKKKAYYQSRLQKQYPQRKTSRRLGKLNQKRNNKIKDILHKTSRRVTNMLMENNISELVIGYNKEWKQTINLGNRNNQAFSFIPHKVFMEKLRYKCHLIGIRVLIQEESYTSKCSALDLEPVQKQERYMGKRIKRGLFVSREGILINADVNGSSNIGRKAFGDEYVQNFIANRGYGQYPIRIHPGK